MGCRAGRPHGCIGYNYPANLITVATALSMSSIVTNIRIGTGGAYSIITKSLGLEAGGAVGIPLYLSQAISVAFYIAGFTECWRFIFPTHNAILIPLIVWLCIFVISYTSAKLAFRVQYIIMAVIFLSLISIFLGKGAPQVDTFGWQGGQLSHFWIVFAIFFPAVTGVLAGASMSGELNDPKQSIPKGTLAAVAISFCIYVILAVWITHHASANQLVENKSILIHLGRWKLLVVAGVMGATLSSAISMFVGSPRTLLALSKHSIIPLSSSFMRINKRGEPVTAILFTAFLVLITLLLGTLDSVASLLTMIFLITYGGINISVFIEQTLGITSFRPAFRVPRFISFFGGVGCLMVMFLINIKFSIIAFILLVTIYIILMRRKMKVHAPNVRSGVLIFLAEKFAKAAALLPYYPKIWKPNLVLPVNDISLLREIMPLVHSIVSPSGRVLAFKVIERTPGDIKKVTPPSPEGDGAVATLKERNKRDLDAAVEVLREEGLFVETSVVESSDTSIGSLTLLQMSKDMFFPPNTLFYILGDEEEDFESMILLRRIEQEGLGGVVLKFHPEFRLGQEQVINLWIRKQSPNIDLAVLIALQLAHNWEGRIRLIQVVDSQEEVEETQAYLDKLKKLVRLPLDVEVNILVGNFRKVLASAPLGDINIFGMPKDPDLGLVRETFDSVQTSVFFLRDSEHESAIA